MNQNDLRLEIQRYCFATHDMQLYLDTHPDDKKAFSLFKSLAQKAKELKSQYVKEFGPLTPMDNSELETYMWLDSPWPWEKGGNK